MKVIDPPENFAEWQIIVKGLLEQKIPPQDTIWLAAGQRSLFSSLETNFKGKTELKLPETFLKIARIAICYRSEDRFSFLYDILWQVSLNGVSILKNQADSVIRELYLRLKAVRRDIHKLHAFVRFKQVADNQYCAWYQPEHYSLGLGARFFVARFGNMNWQIITSDRTAAWDGKSLTFLAGQPLPENLITDAEEDLWLEYYSSIYNPARLNISAMQGEMPKKFWRFLPEAQLIDPLVKASQIRVAGMHTERITFDTGNSLSEARERAQSCSLCSFACNSTQTVFGSGDPHAKIMIIGEQPGDEEDKCGEPFAGPAGEILNLALDSADLDRKNIYLTNSVKHFKWLQSGMERIHRQPSGEDISLCRPWLDAEIKFVKPEVLVCLGLSAVQSVTGRSYKMREIAASEIQTRYNLRGFASYHPSFVLRTRDEAVKNDSFGNIVKTLILARNSVGNKSSENFVDRKFAGGL